ncbi:PEP-CTERM sorting domain-containing protein [Aquabacterium sp.]|uniref:PEP-CTERM sorting domain-containing protein n=1 Tax=Aquabacterium sp. TaxID=1872578 RepID=UPI00198FCAD1|nr:PEP-CTERM sorting domain-containing protein [Aquabacterium sp.]MBC7699303.1 PEP-CTERM sorting domain-containing protein [Aquabacterium sp.]
MNKPILTTALAAMALACAVSAHANSSDLGMSLNGLCVAGSCPATAADSAPSEQLSFAHSLQLADGDVYQAALEIDRTLSPIEGHRSISLAYLGRVVDGALVNEVSQADTFDIAIFRAWQTPTGQFTSEMTGKFSAGLGLSSSVGIQLSDYASHAVVADYGVFDAPGGFSKTLSYHVPVSAGLALTQTDNGVRFGAGSAVGSSILIGAPVPELGTIPLMGMGLGAMFLARRKRKFVI